MNDKNSFERNESELNTFEQKLRSIAPSLPQTSWEDIPIPAKPPSISNRLKSDEIDNPTIRSSNRWLQLLTHATAILIGIGLGALWMSNARSADATSTVALKPESDMPPGNEAPKTAPPNSESNRRNKNAGVANQPNLGSRRPEQRDFDSRSIISVTRIMNAYPLQPRRIEYPPEPIELPSIPPHNSTDQPKSALELMRELLDGKQALLTREPNSAGGMQM